jgi:YD repeat-containing protein
VPGNWGWGGVNDAILGYVTYATQLETGSCFASGEEYYWSYTEYYDWNYNDASGTGHYFNLSVGTNISGNPPPGGWQRCEPNPPSPQGSGAASALDGSGYTLTGSVGVPTASIGDPSGNTIIPPAVAWGSNGQLGGIPNGTYSVTDPNANEISAAISGTTTTFTDTLGTTALTVSGTPPNPVTLTYTNASGGSSQFTINYTSQTVYTNFGCNGINEYPSQSADLVSSVERPDGAYYYFYYDYAGRLTKVTLPTGGSITYAYTGGSNNTGITCADGSTATLTRTTPDGTWTYAHSESGAAWTTTETDPAGNQTVYNFQGIYETERQIKQGSTTLETVYTCYGANGGSAPSPPCNSSSVSLPITQVAATVQHNDTNQEAETVTDYNSLGLPTEVDEYGYGNGSPSSIYQKTYLSYCPNSTYCSASTTPPSRVYQVQTYLDGTTLSAQADYSYDGHGNLLTETHTNTGGSPSSISRSSTYNSNGTVATAKDFNGNQTNYTYTGTDNCNESFPTSIAPPLIPATNIEWNCNNGQVSSATDPNNQTTTYSYDEMNRPSEVDFPDGGKTKWSYPSAAEIDRSTLLTGSTYRTDTTLLDGLGRVLHAKLTSQTRWGPTWWTPLTTTSGA